ncbi:MAG: hypothetical protein HW387_576 [Parachlamydiales bacterium]|nr:hypothetical protein [Parachlamydiales bacterium]
MYSFTHKLLALSAISTVAFAQSAAKKNSDPTSNPAKKALPPIESVQMAKKVDAFKAFTAKVLANKVRIRSKADLESRIVRQVNKNDLLLIVGEEGDFWAVQPPKGTKAYIFRSYVLDNVVEANRVNVRLEPHVDAPIIGQLQAGDKVQGEICAMNHKWLEIAPPHSSCFFVSKEFVEKAGGPEYLAAMEKRKGDVEELMSAAFFLAEAECKKIYEEMSPQEAIEKFQTVIRSYTDFPESVQTAKEGLALLKDTYLQKKISYLEARAELSPTAKEELLARHQAENRELLIDNTKPDPSLWGKKNQAKLDLTDRMRFWDTMEESLYLSWAAFHTGKKMDDFYQEQKANATIVTGKIENYDHAVKAKPGDYVLRGNDAPVAYLYSTQVDLEKYAGKNVTMLVSPRPNNHFAFPAYFVLSVE